MGPFHQKALGSAILKSRVTLVLGFYQWITTRFMGQTTLTTAEDQTQNFPALVQEMRRRLMLSTEQFAYRLHETPTLVHSWQYAKRRPTKKAQAQLKKVLLEMGEMGRDLIQDYRL